MDVRLHDLSITCAVTAVCLLFLGLVGLPPTVEAQTSSSTESQSTSSTEPQKGGLFQGDDWTAGVSVGGVAVLPVWYHSQTFDGLSYVRSMAQYAAELSIFEHQEMTLRHTRGGHNDPTGPPTGTVFLDVHEVSLMYGLVERGRVGQVSLEAGPSIGVGKLDAAYQSVSEVDHKGPARAWSFGLGLGASAYLTPVKYVGIGLEAPVFFHDKVIGWAVMPSLKIGKLF